jgi:hypothetical protein
MGEHEMDERITTIRHKGKAILYADFSSLKGQDVVALAKLIPAATQNIPELRILVDGTDSRGSRESMAAFKDLFTELSQADRNSGTMKAAGIGVGSGLGRILFDGLVRLAPIPIRAFGSKEEALDWLVED